MLIYKVIRLIITLFLTNISIMLIIQGEKLNVKSEAKLFRSYITDSFFRLCCPIYFKLCILLPVTVMDVKYYDRGKISVNLPCYRELFLLVSSFFQ